jgi:hypothetical protein
VNDWGQEVLRYICERVELHRGRCWAAFYFKSSYKQDEYNLEKIEFHYGEIYTLNWWDVYNEGPDTDWIIAQRDNGRIFIPRYPVYRGLLTVVGK